MTWTNPSPRRRSVHLQALRFEQRTRQHLRQHRWLGLHAVLIGLCSFGLCWGVSRGLDALGVDSLAWRPLLALWCTWPLFLLLLAAWARWLISREPADPDALSVAADVADIADIASVGNEAAGSGASLAELLGAAASEGLALLPLLVVLVLGTALLGTLVWLLGLLLPGLLGVELLVSVAVELAFAAWAGQLAWQVQREGWWRCAMRLSWRPLVALSLACALGGWGLHWAAPTATTVPQALRLLVTG